MEKTCYFAPATSANLSAGYDILGMAIDLNENGSAIGDRVTVSKSDQQGVNIQQIIGDNHRLPVEPNLNTASVAVQALLDEKKYTGGLSICIEKNMPLCSGLGSSAASAAAAVAATNHLLGFNLTKEELIPFAMQGEKMASGQAHADNVAPSLLGGIVLIKSYLPLVVVSLPIPQNLFISIVHPSIEINTKQARAQIPQDIPTGQCTQQMGNIAAFISSLYTEDMALLSSSIEDWIAEPARAKNIPGFSLVKQAAIDAGALGAGLSGSGPSMFAFSKSLTTAEYCAQQMSQVFSKQGILSQHYFGKINEQGAQNVD